MRRLLETPFLEKNNNHLNFIVNSTMNEIMKLNELKEDIHTDEEHLTTKVGKSNQNISLTNMIDEVIENLFNEDEDEESLEEISTAGGSAVQGYAKHVDDI